MIREPLVKESVREIDAFCSRPEVALNMGGYEACVGEVRLALADVATGMNKAIIRMSNDDDRRTISPDEVPLYPIIARNIYHDIAAGITFKREAKDTSEEIIIHATNSILKRCLAYHEGHIDNAIKAAQAGIAVIGPKSLQVDEIEKIVELIDWDSMNDEFNAYSQSE